MNESAKQIKRRYYAKSIRKFTIEFNRNTDADILEKFEKIANKQGFIKALLREKLAQGGEAQYYILTGAKAEPMECYGVVTMWGEDGGAWELFETEDEVRAEVEKRLAASTYTQKEIDRGHPYEEIALMAWDEDEDDYIYCDSIEYFYHEACR